jgi:hypothetical protein
MTAFTHNQPNRTNDGTRDLFLSYNSRDCKFVIHLYEFLRQRNVKNFLERNALTPGTPWQSELE